MNGRYLYAYLHSTRKPQSNRVNKIDGLGGSTMLSEWIKNNTHWSKHPSPIQIDKKTHNIQLRWDQHSLIESSLLRVISIHLLQKTIFAFTYSYNLSFVANIQFSWFQFDCIQNIFQFYLKLSKLQTILNFLPSKQINSKVKNLEKRKFFVW